MPSTVDPNDSLASYLENGIPIAAPQLRIAHISDLHFVTHPVLRRLAFGGMHGHDSVVITALQTQLRSMEVDMLFVTGDLTTWGDKRSLRDALLFVKRLARSLGLRAKQVQIIPGNHDVLIDYYRASLKSRNFTSICGDAPMLRVLKVKGVEVAVYSFDSTLRTGVWPFTSNRGQITAEAFNDFNRAQAQIPGGVTVRLVQLHHHPLPIPYKLDNGVGGVLTTMTNGATFADRMQECGIHVVMHGHEHFPYSCQVSYHPEINATVVLSAGTASQIHNREMSFNYVAIKPGSGVALTRYVYRETGFSVNRDATRVFAW
jgi:3',5'-cyclic AMP phosphodiesterase CpdA